MENVRNQCRRLQDGRVVYVVEVLVLGSNSIQCTSCQKWVHKKCSGIKGSMYKVMKSLICRGCSNPVISTGHTSVDIGASANLEVVDEFCYLGDVMSVDGDADAAVEARLRIEWNKFRQSVPLLTNRNISLIRRGRLYSSCVRSSMLTEVRPGLSGKKMTNEVALLQTEIRMVRWMCIVKVKDRVRSKELRERLGIDDIILVLQQNRLRWYGHVLRKEDTDWVKKCVEYEVEGSRPRGFCVLAALLHGTLVVDVSQTFTGKARNLVGLLS